MARPSYVCTICSEHFTRRYSAQRHNNNLHYGAAEIVRLIDYLAGRSSGQYTPNNPFWFKRKIPYGDVGSLTIADSAVDTFHSKYIPRQTPIDASQYPARPIHRSLPTIDHQSYGAGLSRETKLQELLFLVIVFTYIPSRFTGMPLSSAKSDVKVPTVSPRKGCG
jgi:hypothetical protein